MVAFFLSNKTNKVCSKAANIIEPVEKTGEKFVAAKLEYKVKKTIVGMFFFVKCNTFIINVRLSIC